MLLEWLQTVQDELRMTFSNAVLIKVIMHTAFAFERVIKQNPIAFPEEEEMNDQLENVLHITEKTLKPYEEKLGLAISEDEKCLSRPSLLKSYSCFPSAIFHVNLY